MTWGDQQRYAEGAPPGAAAPSWTHTTAPAGRRTLRGWLLVGLVLIGFSVAALVLAAYYDATLGVMTTLLAILLAVIPLGIVVPTFLWLDRFEAEPWRYLVVAFLWGALVAALLAGVFNTGAHLVFSTATGTDEALLATAVFFAPVVEEGAKGVLILLVWWLRRREFDGITDGMVYAGLVAAGFAFTENIQYLGLAYREGGQEALTGIFVARCLFTPFAHPMFTVLTGIGIGIAASSRSRVTRVLAPVAGFVLACLAHALWNLSALTGGAGLVTVYFLVEVPIFLAFLGLVVWARQREGRLIGRYLSDYADAGWLAPSELQMLTTMRGRRAARTWARQNGGRAALRSMRDLQDSASELALLRLRMQHGTADAHAVDTERQLLGALTQRRAELAGTV